MVGARCNMNLLAIDPGPVESAWAILSCGLNGGLPAVLTFGKKPNDLEVRYLVGEWSKVANMRCIVETVASYGMPVGASIFETCRWEGRFREVWGRPVHRIARKDVKLQLCGSARAKDPNVRQALIDLYGGVEGKAKAIGLKAFPGPLYGVATDVWAALAVGVAWWQLNKATCGSGS